MNTIEIIDNQPITINLLESIPLNHQHPISNIQGLQETLDSLSVGGVVIKTINSYSLLGSGNVQLNTSDIEEGTRLYLTNARVDARVALHSDLTNNPHNVTKSQIGLGNVDNTSDSNKPISSATQTALDSKQNNLVSGTNIKTVNNESLLGSGNITINGGGSSISSTSDLPEGSNLYYTNARVDTRVAVHGNRTDNPHSVTKSQVGLGNVDNTSDLDKPISTATQTALDGKENSITSGTTSQYYRGDKSWQTLNKAAVGLANVDNTSDLSKPINTATQTALDSKQENLVSGTNIKTINNQSLLGSGNINISGGGSSISSTSDLPEGTNLYYTNTRADARVSLHSDLTNNPHNVTKSQVGLGNVDNTSDINKPISSAVQTALDGKENEISSGTTSQYYRGDKSWQTLNKAAVGLNSVPDIDATNADNITSGVLSITRGGTGETSASSAINALMPSQSGQSGRVLGTNGSSILWVSTLEVLTATRDYYVRTDGSDSNNGLTNTIGGAFLTIQKAIDTVAGIVTNGFAVNIFLQSGTYTITAPIVLKDPVGSGRVTINSVGGTSTIEVGSGYTNPTSDPNSIFISEARNYIIGNVILTNPTALGVHHLVVWTGGLLTVNGTTFGSLGSHASFGSCHMNVFNGGILSITNTTYNITGGHLTNTTVATRHINCTSGIATLRFGGTCAISGTVRFNGFYGGSVGSSIVATGRTYTGSLVSGCTKHILSGLSILDTNNNVAAVPGSIAGTVSGGSQAV